MTEGAIAFCDSVILKELTTFETLCRRGQQALEGPRPPPSVAAAAVACGEDAISSGPLKAKKDTLTLRGEGGEGRPTALTLGRGKFPAHSLFLGGELNLFLRDHPRIAIHSVTMQNAGIHKKRLRIYLTKFDISAWVRGQLYLIAE